MIRKVIKLYMQNLNIQFNKTLSLKIIFSLVLFTIILSIGSSVNAAGPGGTSNPIVDCVADLETWDATSGTKTSDTANGIPDDQENPATAEAFQEQCQPQRLDGLQDDIVRIIYVAWLGGIIAFGIVVFIIGYNYMTSLTDSQKKAAQRKNIVYAIVGLVVLLGSQPLTAVFMQVFVTDDSECFGALNTPGLVFFFPEVCDPSEVSLAAVCRVNDIEDLSVRESRCDELESQFGSDQVKYCGEPDAQSASEEACAYLSRPGISGGITCPDDGNVNAFTQMVSECSSL